MIQEKRAKLIRYYMQEILKNENFSNAPVLACFLEYVVERTCIGEAASIKAYAIAVDALGRPATFDPSVDNVVRVTAQRVRRALRLYYASAGANDRIQVQIPVGTYVPEFLCRAQPQGVWHNALEELGTFLQKPFNLAVTLVLLGTMLSLVMCSLWCMMVA